MPVWHQSRHFSPDMSATAAEQKEPKSMNSRSIKNKMQAALIRSGSVMEFRIVSMLADSGFFVQPNQTVADPKTGKTREIDFIAEEYDPDELEAVIKQRVSVLVRFVCEAKNDASSVVVLTKVP